LWGGDPGVYVMLSQVLIALLLMASISAIYMLMVNYQR
jgi:hypothetical protein